MSPEARDGYWLTPWFEERLARELEACRSLEALQAVESRIQKRYAATAQWRAFNHEALEPLRQLARTRRRALRALRGFEDGGSKEGVSTHTNGTL